MIIDPTMPATKPVNPFFTGKIDFPDKYFCDRKEETNLLIKRIENGSNIVIKSPRRIGKSSLIKHLFRQREIQNKYNTLFVDIFGTKNMEEFVQELQSAFLNAPFAKTKVGRKRIINVLSSAYFQLNTDPAGNLTGLRLGVTQPSQTNVTLKEMFKFLEQTKRPNIIAFDEFQKINDYPENAAAILRSYIQQSNNTLFIFSGSSRHLLNSMFEYPMEPFYRSASSMDLAPIEMVPYTTFCQEMFRQYGKDIEMDAVAFVYKLFSANTYDLQEVMKETFQETRRNKTASIRDVQDAIGRLLDTRDMEFRDFLDKIENEKTRRLLLCIAHEGIAKGLTSGGMIKKYHLDNASSVQNGLKTLMGDNIHLITLVSKGVYQLQDRFFELWLARRDNTLQLKFDGVDQRFLETVLV
ncbi:MAG: ATP-binding protein [Bacteroidales bacterium]|nr:ATP-binding protein [Bacteroidales bacterium]